jgi:hypothetical protein
LRLFNAFCQIYCSAPPRLKESSASICGMGWRGGPNFLSARRTHACIHHVIHDRKGGEGGCMLDGGHGGCDAVPPPPLCRCCLLTTHPTQPHGRTLAPQQTFFGVGTRMQTGTLTRRGGGGRGENMFLSFFWPPISHSSLRLCTERRVGLHVEGGPEWAALPRNAVRALGRHGTEMHVCSRCKPTARQS